MKKKRIAVILITIFLIFQNGYSQIHSANFQHANSNTSGFKNENSSNPISLKLTEKYNDFDLYKNRIVPIFMMVAGIGIAGIWSADIINGKFSAQGNFFKWKEGENMLWPHIFAEYLTSVALISGGLGLYNSKDWAINISFAALGALTYTAINSSAWVLAEKDRIGYGVPMWISLTGAVISFAILLN